jgi:uncharacterized protein YndB with AHSA1/START domain
VSVVSGDKDYDAHRLVVVAEFAAPIEQVWQLWADPRKLERWWGPPGYPATFEKHDLTPGGEVTYFMTGPDGNRSHGTWRVTAVDPPTSLQFKDAFADTDGTPVADMPVSTVSVELAERGDGTRMEMRSAFESRDDMDKVVDMGTVEGLRQAVSQMEGVLDA